ncbi:Cyclic AMP-dependent transcription factor ATF-7 [Orchesella cincta]|uniref:Cyclic AMP-dependent transcription factor ATF-7 n=1 Tax=Orchesella cincta TaxID=48709 RepID=A0A1D2NL97_ORCCI|nr:Cyclic AMP-dependent transcription factor ATF-7 [Orchesella cincta]
MELEKAFKCGDCGAKFSAMDQLQVHQRRHEMSLSLSKTVASSSGSSLQTPLVMKGSLSAGIIGFVDETPTPTRFFRNCEEVGLFQDLQNVNPFDEDFKKAANSATATPSGDHPFEFNFTAAVVGAPSTPINETPLCLRTPRPSKRRYSEQDTLNTPQVFPFSYFSSSTGSCPTLTTNTASMSACLTPTPTPPNSHGSAALVPSPPEALRVQHQPQVETPTVSTTYNHEEHVSIIAYTSAISQQTSNKNDPSGSGAKTISSPKTASELIKSMSVSVSSISNKKSSAVSQLKTRSKPNLKLDLKTVVSRNKSLTLAEKHSTNCNVNQSQQSTRTIDTGVVEDSLSDPLDKKELLERNRAAAHRSRERRKQWIYGLESRCRALETLLAQSQAEVVRLSSENETLKHHLHEMSKSKEPQNSSQSSIIVSNSSIVDVSKSIVIHQTSGDVVETVIQEPLVDNVDISSGMVATIVSPIVLPTVKAKRGRPRKGEERRVPILAVSITSSEEVNIAPKIPILRISQPTKKKKD